MKERRNGPDIIIKGITALNILCGTLMIVALLLMDRAKPRIETFFDRLLNVQLASGWDQNLLRVNLYVLAALGLCSVVGLYLNRRRARRRTDSYRKPLLLSLLFCLLCIIFYLLILPHS